MGVYWRHATLNAFRIIFCYVLHDKQFLSIVIIGFSLFSYDSYDWLTPAAPTLVFGFACPSPI